MSIKKYLAATAALAVAAGAMLAAPATAATSLTGSGSSFVSNYIETCKAVFTADTGISLTYNAVGSGAGRSAFNNRTVDFAASDAPYGATEAAPDGFVYVPLVAGPIAIMYNLPMVKAPVQLTPEVLAKIFAGQIKKWNDPQLKAVNKVTTKVAKKVNGKIVKVNGKVVYITKTTQLALPNLPIKVYYRSDGSGTSEVFTDYLSQLVPTVFNKGKNKLFTAAFPGALPSDGTFQAAAGTDGVSNGVKSSTGAIAYGEVSFAKERKLGVAKLKNSGGKYLLPTAGAAAKFLSNFDAGKNGTIKANFKNPDPGAYNLSSFAYGLAYTKGQDADKSAAVKKFFQYLVGVGTTKCTALAGAKGYAPLQGDALATAKSQIANID